MAQFDACKITIFSASEWTSLREADSAQQSTELTTVFLGFV